MERRTFQNWSLTDCRSDRQARQPLCLYNAEGVAATAILRAARFADCKMKMQAHMIPYNRAATQCVWKQIKTNPTYVTKNKNDPTNLRESAPTCFENEDLENTPVMT